MRTPRSRSSRDNEGSIGAPGTARWSSRLRSGIQATGSGRAISGPKAFDEAMSRVMSNSFGPRPEAKVFAVEPFAVIDLVAEDGAATRFVANERYPGQVSATPGFVEGGQLADMLSRSCNGIWRIGGRLQRWVEGGGHPCG